MKTQLILATICIYLCAATAEDSLTEAEKEIVKLVKGTAKEVEKIHKEAHELTNRQKGIEQKIKQQREEIESIKGLDETLVKLESDLLQSFNTTVLGVGNLTAIIEATQSQSDRAIQNLTKVEGEIRSTLADVEANQGKYEKDLDQVATVITTHLAGIDQILRQAVVGELIGLDHKAQVLHQQQQEINGQVRYLEKLNGLASSTNNKLEQLECGLTSLNRSQTETLNNIEGSVLGVKVATTQIDQKIGVLLGNQKNIEKALKDCKSRHHPQNPKPHSVWTHPEYAPGYPQPKPAQKPKFQTTYASEEEAENLYKLWYGKGQK